MELNFTLLSDIDKNYLIDPIEVDISKIKEYQKQFGSSENLRGEDLWRLGDQTTEAMGLCLDYWYVADRFAKHSKLKFDQITSEVYLNEGNAALAALNIKPTVDSLRSYLERHPKYLAAKNVQNSWETMRDWLLQMKELFREKHYFVKKRLDQLISERAAV